MSDDWGDDGGDDWGDGGGGGGGGDDDGWGDDAPAAGGDDDGWGDDGAGTGGNEMCDFCDGSGCAQCQGQEMTLEVKISNAYYIADEERSTNPEKALASFREVVEMSKGTTEDEIHSIAFNALRHIVLLLFQLDKLAEVETAYQALLNYFVHVSQNESDGAVDKILNETSTGQPKHAKVRDRLYHLTANYLSNQKDKANMLFSLQMRQCQELAAQENYREAERLLHRVHDRCKLPDGRDDAKNKGSELLAIYALELKMATATSNSVRMRELYERTRDLTAAVKDPKVQSVIKECWGKMFGDEGNWQRAYTEFYSAFTSYQEAAEQASAKRALKYTVMANMLCKGIGNPFAAREARVYQNDPDIVPIINLRTAYEKRDVILFAKSMATFNLSADDFIKSHMKSTIEEFQRLTALRILKSYRRIRIAELASKLQITAEETEALLIQLILDDKLEAKIDQVMGILDLSSQSAGGAGKYSAIDQWETSVKNLVKHSPYPRSSRFNRQTVGNFSPF